jgi:hypothetical protein
VKKKDMDVNGNVSSTNKTDRHDVAGILLKVALIIQNQILTLVGNYSSGI